MYRLISRKAIIQLLMIVFVYVLCGTTVYGAANAIEPPDDGSTGLTLVNTFESVLIDSDCFSEGSFSLPGFYGFDVYVNRPSTTHLYVDEAEAIYLKPSAGNNYFTSGYYLLDGYIDNYDLQSKTSGIWLVDNDGDLRVYSFGSTNDFYASGTTSVINWTFSSVYTSFSAFDIRRVEYADDVSLWGYYSAYTRGGTSFDQETFLFVDRPYSETEGFGNYYIVTPYISIDLVQEYNLIYGFYYKLTFNYLNSYQMHPSTQYIPSTYFFDF
ncbi:MAG: hypothetical protein KKG64_04685 [Firmicutes bacterium]|nr:hypothetical protein [Bacillota bacterium]